jgi:hypothetical protein
VILGNKKNDRQDTEYILRLFGKRQGAARRKYSDFVFKGIEQGQRIRWGLPNVNWQKN